MAFINYEAVATTVTYSVLKHKGLLGKLLQGNLNNHLLRTHVALGTIFMGTL